MAEVKRYRAEIEVSVGRHLVKSEFADVVLADDYTALERAAAELRRAFERAEADVQALEREVERLRAIEARAAIVIEQSIIGRDPKGNTYYMVMPHDMGHLAEACGRKGL